MTMGAGLTVTLRVRMSAHDAHYAGELVDGARILALFGDVATELLIRLDGDEGLFRAYEAIEFLAPVRAGDFLEATGGITKGGGPPPCDGVGGPQGRGQQPPGRPLGVRGRRPRRAHRGLPRAGNLRRAER